VVKLKADVLTIEDQVDSLKETRASDVLDDTLTEGHNDRYVITNYVSRRYYCQFCGFYV